MSEASLTAIATLPTPTQVSSIASPGPQPVSYLPSTILCHSMSSPRLWSSGHAASDTEKIILLETEHRRLQEEITYLTLDAQIREEELNKFRSDYYAERFQANVRKRLAKSAEDDHAARDLRLEQAEKFISSMVEVGLHQPVLSRAWKAVAAGAVADDALIDSIKKAATIPGTSWSRIIPAVVGPRTPDDYLAAIDMTLKVTKELKNAKKISKFWKTKAKQDASLKDLITPSPSKLSDTSFTEDLMGYEERAVDDLLKQLKAGGIHASTKSSQPAMTPSPAPTITSCLRPRVVVPQQNTSPYGRGLAPLASQVFEEDVMGYSSPTKQSKFSPTKKLRSIFSEIDINVEPRPRKKIPEKHGKKPSARLRGKRKAVLVERVLPESVLAIRSTLDACHKRRSKIDNLPLDLDRASPPLPTSAEFSPQPPGGPGTFSAEEALESLERICAGFSSGSFGSLGSFSESSTTKTLQSASAAVVTSDRTAEADDARHKPPATTPLSQSIAPYSVKTSTPLVSRFHQMRSLSRPSLFASQFRPPAVSSPKAKQSPRKIFLRKHTSPLHITKKARVATATGSTFPDK